MLGYSGQLNMADHIVYHTRHNAYNFPSKHSSDSKLYQNERFICHMMSKNHDDVIKWKHFPRYWPFVRGIHRSPVNSAHKGQWRGALMFPLICVWINGWVNNREAGDLRRKQAHYDVIVMLCFKCISITRREAANHELYNMINGLFPWETNKNMDLGTVCIFCHESVPQKIH